MHSVVQLNRYPLNILSSCLWNVMIYSFLDPLWVLCAPESCIEMDITVVGSVCVPSWETPSVCMEQLTTTRPPRWFLLCLLVSYLRGPGLYEERGWTGLVFFWQGLVLCWRCQGHPGIRSGQLRGFGSCLVITPWQSVPGSVSTTPSNTNDQITATMHPG